MIQKSSPGVKIIPHNFSLKDRIFYTQKRAWANIIKKNIRSILSDSVDFTSMLFWIIKTDAWIIFNNDVSAVKNQ